MQQSASAFLVSCHFPSYVETLNLRKCKNEQESLLKSHVHCPIVLLKTVDQRMGLEEHLFPLENPYHDVIHTGNVAGHFPLNFLGKGWEKSTTIKGVCAS